MGYVLLWIENLSVSLLLVATLLACAGRLRRRWLRHVLAVLAPLLLTLIYAAMTVATAFLQFKARIDTWFFPTLALTVFFITGAVWLRIRGLRYVDAESTSVAAAAWPRCKLAIALAVAAVLHSMTFWNMDLVARQQLAALRAEAGALGLSVAPPSLLDRDNAAVVYQQAFEAMGRRERQMDYIPNIWQWDEKWSKAWEEIWTNWHDPVRIDFDLHDKELRSFLSRQAPAIKLLRQAAAKPDCSFDRDYGRPDFSMLLPELAPLCTSARLLALDAICSASDDNYHQAVEDINGLFSMAGHIGRDPLLVSTLVAIEVDRLAIDSLQVMLAFGRAAADDLTDLKAAVDNTPYRNFLRRAFRSEEAFRLAAFEQLSAGLFTLRQITILSAGPQCIPNAIPMAIYRVFFLGDDLAAQRRFASELNRAVMQPYWRAKDQLKDFDRRLAENPSGLLTSVLVPALSHTIVQVTEVEARRNAARLGLALYGYRAHNGQYPAKLDDLVPEFVAAVPLDPFDGKPMKLKRTDHGLIVYSVGPDLIDDNGAPLDKQNKTGDVSFTLSEMRAAEL
jgi:hypothetical protein